MTLGHREQNRDLSRKSQEVGLDRIIKVSLGLAFGESQISTVGSQCEGLPGFQVCIIHIPGEVAWGKVPSGQIKLISITSIWLFKSSNCGKPLECSPWGISTSYLETQTEFYEQKICWEACSPHLL